LERRSFIKNSCAFCVSIAAAGILQSLQGCSPLNLYHAEAVQNKVTIPVNLLSNDNVLITRMKNLDYDIAIVKKSTQQFDALKLICTHANNELQFTGKNFLCPLHGSTFDIHGMVTKGPAENQLTKFRTELVDENLIVIIA
jgi:Rieske Fe-S protein